LIRALLVQVLYGIRSERQLMERIRYDLLLRWFVGLSMDEEEWVATVFTKNRERLMQGEISQRLLTAVLQQALVPALRAGFSSMICFRAVQASVRVTPKTSVLDSS
jgi:hypothetical protein